MKKVRVRIAPSPTGDPHVGTAYIALFNYVFAKKHSGDFIIRIEDTDRERSTKDSEKLILDYLSWLGLNWDEGPYRQSDRREIYYRYAMELVEKGVAYKCYCSEERLGRLKEKQRRENLPPGYDGKCRDLINSEENEGKKFVVRLKVPRQGNTIVKDAIRGDVIFENVKIDDQVLLKSDGFPTYHLANVVDDHLMNISHVIRAEEWIPSTPKHILLYEAFGWELPVWVHMPLLRNRDKSKISKRKNAVSLEYYHDEGFLKEALLNFLALMGWSLDGKTEIFNMDDMIEKFEWKSVALGSPILDVEKLKWINRTYIREYDLDALMELLKPFYMPIYGEILDKEFLKKIVDGQRERSDTLKELAENIGVFIREPQFFFDQLTDEDKKKAINILKEETASEVLKQFENEIDKVEYSPGAIKEMLLTLKERLSLPLSKIFPPLRILISGMMRGNEMSQLIFLFGKKEVIRRINSMKSLMEN